MGETECDGNAIYRFEVPVRLQRRGVETKLLLASANATPDRGLIALVAKARLGFDRLNAEQAKSINELADNLNMDASEMSRILPLAFLAPDIVAVILDGTQPSELTVERLKRLGPLPHEWPKQQQMLGFVHQ